MVCSSFIGLRFAYADLIGLRLRLERFECDGLVMLKNVFNVNAFNGL